MTDINSYISIKVSEDKVLETVLKIEATITSIEEITTLEGLIKSYKPFFPLEGSEEETEEIAEMIETQPSHGENRISALIMER